MDVNVITLENKKDYIIMATIENAGNRYFVLVNEVDKDDMCVRKAIKNKNNDDVLVKLDNKEEFYKVITLLNKLNRKESNE